MLDQDCIPLRLCDRWMSAEPRAALHRLPKGWLSVKNWALLGTLSHRGLSAEDWAALSSLWQMSTEDGTATKSFQTKIKSISCWYLLAYSGRILALMNMLEGLEVLGINNMSLMLCARTSMVDSYLRRFREKGAWFWGHTTSELCIGGKVGQWWDSCSRVRGRWRVRVNARRGSRSIQALIRWIRSLTGTLQGLGMEDQVSSRLWGCANTTLYSGLNAGRQIDMSFKDMEF